VDSKPEPAAIEAVLYGGEAIYQQPSIYLENYKRISSFEKVGALLQTKWELCRNVPVLYANYRRYQQKRSILSLPTCTGHGLFIRSDIFQQHGRFDTRTLTEDLELGYRLAFHKVPITLLKAVDFTAYAPSSLATIIQTSRWFSGEVNLYRYHKKAPKSWLLTLLVLKRYYLTFKWAFGAPLIFFALIVLTIRYPVSIVLVFLSLYLYLYKPFKMLYTSAWADYLGETKHLIILVLLGSLRLLFNSCGPFHYFLTAPLYVLLGKSSTFIRTPKN